MTESELVHDSQAAVVMDASGEIGWAPVATVFKMKGTLLNGGKADSGRGLLC